MGGKHIVDMAGETNLGLCRRHNEDCFCLADQPGRRCALAVVADGVGGHERGELASLIVCRGLLRAFLGSNDHELMADGGAVEFLSANVAVINTRLFQRNLRERLDRPMCTTFAALMALPGRIAIGWAGDSRCYEYNPATGLRQLTSDHTLAAEYELKYGKQLPHDNRLNSIIARAVGPREPLAIDTREFPRPADSRYLVCSDGLSGFVSPDTIENELRDSASAREACGRLIRIALLAGGKDNVTAVAVFPGKE
ncbi:MAG: protein phosphatase 2C domain-containing protein [Victivallaceae bacterium]|nr:protein phosphatase 2C domain-containing protein [Victivallaceae bacterium]